MSSSVTAPTRECHGCGFTLSLFAFALLADRKHRRSRYCDECADAAGKDVGYIARQVHDLHRVLGVRLLIRFGYTRAAEQVLAGGPWPDAREARLMQMVHTLPRQRGTA